MRLAAFLVFAFAPLGAHAAENLEAALGELAAEVVSFVESDAPKKIAIATMIHGDGACSDLSERASNRFQGALFRAKSPTTSIIDRRSLSAIFREQELVEDGTVSPEGAAKIARIAQVDAIVTGTMTTYGDQVELEASMLDAVSGTVLGFAYATFPLTGADKDLLANSSIARCGFAGPAGGSDHKTSAVHMTTETPGAAPPAAPASGATFSNNIFTAEILSLVYSPESGIASFSIRFRNNFNNKIGISHRNKTLSMTDGFGGTFAYGSVWHGIRVCSRPIGFCMNDLQDTFTTLDSNSQAQLTFTASGAKGVSSPVLSLTMEFYVIAEYDAKKSAELITISYFDLLPEVR